MIPLSTLRCAAEDALAYLKAQPDVREAEAFVASNGSLFARLNYTSHIPSNGARSPSPWTLTAWVSGWSSPGARG